MSSYDTTIDWPGSLPRTSPDDRDDASKFSASLGSTTDALETEMDRLDVDRWRPSTGNAHTKSNGLPLANANPDDPGFVLRWQDDGVDYVAACDRYSDLRDNIRSVYLWINETRLRSDRPVVTGGDSFAAAALPGDSDDDATTLREPPHEVLDLSPTAPDAVIKSAARAHKKDAHPDNGGSMDAIERIRRAEEAMLNE